MSKNVFLKLTHQLVASGWVYDCSQTLAGAHVVRRRLRTILRESKPGWRILDVGGGTGALQRLAPADCAYFCLDLEMPKLQRYRQKTADPKPLLANAGEMPIQSGTIDIVACVAVAHHLTDEMLVSVLRESRRVLKDNGRLVFLDAVFNPRRWLGRILWSLDRGSHPKSAQRLRALLGSQFNPVHWERLAFYHEYALGVATKRDSTETNAPRPDQW